MSMTQTLVIARWDRPLLELSINRPLLERLASQGYESPRDSLREPGYSWERADGWQCFAPIDFYAELVPPVEAVEAETGGPALGMGVKSDDHWEVSFVLDGALRWIAEGPSEDGSSAYYEAEMILRWGPDWKVSAAAALARWAAPFATVDPTGIEALMTVRHLAHYDKLVDLQRMLTLIPPRDQHRWWWGHEMVVLEADIPGCRYAVAARYLAYAWRAAGGYPGDRLALAFTDTGVGVWDRDTTTWTQAPVLTYEDAETTLCAEITRRGANG